MRRVLVVQLARFGDLVQTRRLLLSLAAENDTRVHLCVDDSLAGLARMLYSFAHVHSLPAHSAPGNLREPAFASVRACFAEFRRSDFERVYLLNFSPLSFAVASLFDAEQLVGYARVNGQPMRGPWSLIAFSLLHDRRFSPLNLADLWAHLHPSPAPPENVNPIPRQAGSRRIGIVMAGRESRRSLPPPALAACVQAIFQARGEPDLVCIGSKSEKVLVRRMARELSARAVGKIEDRTGETSLTDLPELLLGLDMVLTPDTGAMHLAAHLGVPVQAFFLSSAWCFETGPYGFGHTAWQAVKHCSPCRETAPCPHDLACLEPFRHKAFLAHLAGTFHQGWPEGLTGCVSYLDALGATCKIVDGDDPYSQGRKELRDGLAEYLGLAARGGQPPFMSQALAEFLYREKDWMLPPNWLPAVCRRDASGNALP